MKFYIASSLKNHERVRALAAKLKAAGWVHTYDWTEGLQTETNQDTLETIAEKEFDGVSNADVVLVLSPGGKGTHVELGMAIALNKTVFLCHPDAAYFESDDAICSFYCLKRVAKIVGGTDEIAETVLAIRNKPAYCYDNSADKAVLE